MEKSELRESTEVLLAKISTKLDKVIDELKEVRIEMKSKVEIDDFKELKDRVGKAETKSEALHNKWWFATGIATTVSYIINFLK